MIGIDEAGYGPNLGPLCVAATAWKVGPAESRGRGPAAGETLGDVDLYKVLADIVATRPDNGRIAVADSKQLYKPSSHSKNGRLRHLERGVLTALSACGKPCADWRSLLSPPSLPWYVDYSSSLPIDLDATELTATTDRFSATCKAQAVELTDIRTRKVFPAEVNELTSHWGTKGAALSHISIELLRDVLHNILVAPSAQRPAPVSITSDKHGGRNRYGALLQHHFPDARIETVEESRPRSRYRWECDDSRVDIVFRTNGEAMLPVALASMTAKYHRELAMRAFNAFWTGQITGLRPTAGYPQDAKRFKAEIAGVQCELGIADHQLWRNR